MSNRYLDELECAETLGFHGPCVNEHHQNAYGTMSAPNIIEACWRDAPRGSALRLSAMASPRASAAGS